ncbi:MAG: hypothetical protein JW860_14830 [Sedimentisphaerales bacterium]|nr:hypothetical protein [Sedimentisphaerales bacterium]
MKIIKKLFMAFCLSVLVVVPAGFGQVRLPRLVSDGMVLQREARVMVWGWAEAGEEVTLEFQDKVYQRRAGADGRWAIILSGLQAGGPYTMDISASNHITLEDIMIGDVWVCSGQSNMVLPMERVKYRYADEIAQCDYPAIRQFLVPMRYDFNTPQQDVPGAGWVAANPETVLQFSATAYFFAKELYEKYQAPIGLINASVGGSPAEAWLSEGALKEFPAYLAEAKRCKDSSYINRIKNQDEAASQAWYRTLDQRDEGLKDKDRPWYDPACDASAWPVMELPGYWADKGLGPVNGVVWFRKEIEAPASMAGQPARLVLGAIVDADRAYINGELVGTTSYQYPPRNYQVPGDLLKAGKNIIVVRVISNSGRGGFVENKPYELIGREQTIDLKGQWHYKLGATMNPLPGTTFIQYKPLGLYNGMIAPLLNYSIKGVIWYQGESNTGRPREYYRLFPALIADWRSQWEQGDFPFLYVQLANFMAAKDQPSQSNWAELREAQRRTLAVANTGMAVITDIGEWNDIHPLNKADVGKRLALAAQKVAYGDNEVVYSGPMYESMEIDGNKIILAFTHTGSGLVAQGGGELKHFAIAGADKKFVWARAKIKGDKVVVWSDEVPDPVAVRYAWADNPEGANLYNKEGLPASSFRTDE